MNISCINFNNQKNLIINIFDKVANNTKNFNGYCCLYNNDELIGINIFDYQFCNEFDFGLIFPTPNVLNKIFELTKINLTDFVDNKVIIAKIVSFNPIENTHLNYCDVLINEKEIIKIVCGAKNVRKNMYTVCALNNALLPTGKIIKTNKMMNLVSNGMLCSYNELGLEPKNPGIIDLININDSLVGTTFKEIYVNLK